MACSLMKRDFFQKARYYANAREQTHQKSYVFDGQELSLVNAIERACLLDQRDMKQYEVHEEYSLTYSYRADNIASRYAQNLLRDQRKRKRKRTSESSSASEQVESQEIESQVQHNIRSSSTFSSSGSSYRSQSQSRGRTRRRGHSTSQSGIPQRSSSPIQTASENHYISQLNLRERELNLAWQQAQLERFQIANQYYRQGLVLPRGLENNLPTSSQLVDNQLSPFTAVPVPIGQPSSSLPSPTLDHHLEN